MQQAEMKGSSATPDLRDFRGKPSGPTGGFGFAGRTADDARRCFYGINGGESVDRILEEIGCLLDIVERLASAIAENVEGKDPTSAQLAYAAARFADQASALVSSAVRPNWVQP